MGGRGGMGGMGSLRHESIFEILDSDQWASLSKLLRLALESNPYEPYRERDQYMMWKDQACLNFPLLYLGSLYLYFYAKERGCKTFLFATRDCCHWYRIFEKLFPNFKV